MRTLASLTLACLLLMTTRAAADPIHVPWPLDSAVSIDLSVNPVVVFGNRTIDFTANLDQQFIAFLPAMTRVADVWRATIAVRAREGLLELSGLFPPSPDPAFVNQLPGFPVGTTNLLVFDLIVAGWGTPFPVSLVDLTGARHTAMFETPIPEPASLLLVGTGLALLARRRRRGRPSL